MEWHAQYLPSETQPTGMICLDLNIQCLSAVGLKELRSPGSPNPSYGVLSRLCVFVRDCGWLWFYLSALPHLTMAHWPVSCPLSLYTRAWRSWEGRLLNKDQWWHLLRTDGDRTPSFLSLSITPGEFSRFDTAEKGWIQPHSLSRPVYKERVKNSLFIFKNRDLCSEFHC